MRIFIVGLRRSGTTISWDTFRQDRRLLCYNEPFNPMLRGVPIEIPNRSRTEFIELFRRDSWAFWRHFAPIGRIEELQDDLSDWQVAYLRFLMSRAESICLDTTRCHFRLAALHEVVPDATVVHLFRSSAALLLARRLGGLWRFFAWIAMPIPAKLRDAVYDFVAYRRRRWFPPTTTVCPLVTGPMRARFRDVGSLTSKTIERQPEEDSNFLQA